MPAYAAVLALTATSIRRQLAPWPTPINRSVNSTAANPAAYQPQNLECVVNASGAAASLASRAATSGPIWPMGVL
jgi:hypothetical protein